MSLSFFSGLPFFLCLTAVLALAFLLGILEKPLRWYSLAATLFFVAAIFWQTPIQFFYLVSFCALELILLKGYLSLRKLYGRRESCYCGALLVSLLPLLLSKCGEVSTVSFFSFLGVSYLTFKSLQMVIEIYDGVITEFSAVEFVGFLLFFPSLSSGPIDRSRRFHQDWSTTCSRSEYLQLCGDGLWKLLLGLVYKLVLASAFYRAVEFFGESSAWYAIPGYAYAYGFYMFFDFAGYSLMAVGASYFLGVRTPDNFRAPFISRDIKEFWDRWHITLSHWFRDFLFSRFIMKCSRKKWFKTRLQRACAGFLVNMTVMGMWHGLTPSYLIYGIYHGLLLAAAEGFQKKSKFYKKYKNTRWYQVLSWFLTLQLVMFGFLIFSGKFWELICG